jgi:amino acid permease
LFVSCYVCHYNIPAVHNELQNPSPKRVNYWLRSTTVSASIFYMVIGLAGSAYGHCTPTGKVQGNVLLDFDEDDPFLLVARMCLACTITLAFPLLVIPARDILLRSWFDKDSSTQQSTQQPALNNSDPDTTNEASLQEPLLTNTGDNENSDDAGPATGEEVASDEAPAGDDGEQQQPEQHSFTLRLSLAILVLWSAAAVASCVKSIDIVWDLLGSSLSILLSYLIPCASFIAIVGGSTENRTDYDSDEDHREEEGGNRSNRETKILIAKGMIWVYVPLMVISTANAFISTFLH